MKTLFLLLLPIILLGQYPTSQLFVHLRAYDLNQADSTDVTTWTDQSGTNHSVTQTTVTDKAHYILNKKNGLPVLQFDGANHYYVFPTDIYWYDAGFADSLVVACVVKSLAVGENEILTNWTSSRLAIGMGAGATTTYFMKSWYATTGLVTTTSNSTYLNKWVILIAVAVEGNTKLIIKDIDVLDVDNALDQKTSVSVGSYRQNGGDTHLGKLSTSDGLHWQGYIGEFMAWNRLLTDTEITNTITYLYNTWNCSTCSDDAQDKGFKEFNKFKLFNNWK